MNLHSSFNKIQENGKWGQENGDQENGDSPLFDKIDLKNIAICNVLYSEMFKNTLFKVFIIVLIYDIFYVCYLVIF